MKKHYIKAAKVKWHNWLYKHTLYFWHIHWLKKDNNNKTTN